MFSYLKGLDNIERKTVDKEQFHNFTKSIGIKDFPFIFENKKSCLVVGGCVFVCVFMFVREIRYVLNLLKLKIDNNLGFFYKKKINSRKEYLNEIALSSVLNSFCEIYVVFKVCFNVVLMIFCIV